MNKTHYLVPLILVLGLASLAILPWFQQNAVVATSEDCLAPHPILHSAKPAGSNMTGGSNMTRPAANTTAGAPGSLPTANPAGASRPALHPEEPQPSAHPASHEGRIWPPSANPAGSNMTGSAANITGGAPTANPAGGNRNGLGNSGNTNTG